MENLSNCYQIDRIIIFIIKKNIVNDYHLKSYILVTVDDLFISGRNMQISIFMKTFASDTYYYSVVGCCGN
jgi:hypothetical protein